MRRGKKGGTCAVCGRSSAEGLFWANRVKVLDYGVVTMPLREPDTTEPERCDGCELVQRVRRDFEANPALAARIHGRDRGE